MTARREAAILLSGLLVASVCVFLFALGRAPFIDYDEAIYAEVIADTEAMGSIGILYSVDKPWFEKPPLYFWLAMGSGHVFSDTELAYRLPSALAGIAAVALTFLIGLEVSGSVVGAGLAGFALLTTGAFIDAGRQLRLDVPVSLMILLALYCYLRARRDKRWLVGVLPAIAIGFLFKSVIAFFAIFPILAFALVEREWRWLRSLWLWLGALLALLLWLPWHLYETLRFGESFWQDYLFHQIFARLGSNIIGGVTLTDWIYLKYALLFDLPWVLGAIAAAIWLASDRALRKSREGRAMLAVGLGTFGMLAIFLISATKLFYYLVPTFPLIALFDALALTTLFARYKQRFLDPMVQSGVLLLALGVFGYGVYVGFHFIPALAETDYMASDEAALARILIQEPSYPLRSLNYTYWDTVQYYSGRRVSYLSAEDAKTPCLILVPTDLYESEIKPAGGASGTTPLFEGPAVTLLSYTPPTQPSTD